MRETEPLNLSPDLRAKIVEKALANRAPTATDASKGPQETPKDALARLASEAQTYQPVIGESLRKKLDAMAGR